MQETIFHDDKKKFENYCFMHTSISSTLVFWKINDKITISDNKNKIIFKMYSLPNSTTDFSVLFTVLLILVLKNNIFC